MSEIFIIIGLIVLNGVFSMSETAMISARKSRLSMEAKKGNKSARKALDLSGNSDRFLSTVQIGITLIGILTGIYSGSKIATDLTDFMLSCGVSPSYAYMLAQGLIVVIATYLTIIFGELVPKRIGLSVAETVAKLVARPMNFLARLVSPFVWLLSTSTEIIFNLLGVKSEDGKVTEEEIKSIVKEGAEEGTVEPVEQNIVQRVFLLGNLKIGSIMTHKSEVVWLDAAMSAEEVKEVMKNDLYESYPVADGDLDHVKGMIWLKDLVMGLGDAHFNVGALAREAVYFHEGMSIYKVLEQMKVKKISRGLICDEFGDFVGMVTLKDIFEGLVGAMDNEGEEPEIVKRSDNGGWLVDGQCSLYDLLCYFDCGDLYEASGYHTLAGLILDRMQHIPRCGEKLEWNGFVFEIVDMDGARINKVLVTGKTIS
ncbi:MAG: hemolysin family protein [Paraprevotella sp.]|nr:hemolysin family protein [Paraprevotella sp.]